MANRIACATFVVGMLVGGAAVADPYYLPPEDGMAAAPALHGSKLGGGWLDFDYLWGHFTPVAGTTMTADLVRFGPRVAIGRFLYVGAEIDVGALSGASGAPTTALARDGATSPSSTPGAADMMASIGGGTYVAGKALAGARMFLGPVSGSVELAAGVRDYVLHDAVDRSLGGYFGSAYEAHARIDLWATSKLTIGALANTDLANKSDFSVGVVLGVHFRRYDGARR